MKYRYIAIERQYGSGGSKIACCLSEKTGIPCYGHEILEIAAQKENLSVSEMERYEEKVTSSFLYSLYAFGQAEQSSGNMLTNEGRLFVAERAVVRELADKGSAIFLGHCAADTLGDRKDILRVFRKADKESKKKRIMEEYGIQENMVAPTAKRFDKKRANYYSFNTANKWDDLYHYDVVLDSSVIGINGCVELLAGLTG